MGFVLERPLPTTRRPRAVGLLVLVALVAAGVLGWRATRPELDTHPGTAARAAGGVTMLMETEGYSELSGGVGLGGTLAVLPGGCLGLAGTPEAPAVLLIFPPGTKIRVGRGGVRVHVPGDGDPRWPARTVRPGSHLDGGSRTGRAVPVSTYGGDLSRHTPAGCRRYRAMPIDPGV